MQVLSHIESLEGDLRLVNADRDNVWKQAAALREQVEHLRADLVAARQEVERLESAPASASALSARMRRTLALAEDEAAELRRQAGADAAAVRRAAQADAERLRETAEREAGRVRADTDLLVRRTAELCEQREARASADAERTRQELEAAVEALRQRCLAEIAEREALFRARAAVLARIVGRRARHHIAVAQLREAELARLQDEVARQLRSAQTVLGTAAGRLTDHPTPRPALTP